MKYFKVLIIALCALFLCLAAVFWFLFFTDRIALLNSLVPQPNIYQRPFQNYSVRTVLPQYPVESTATKKVDVTNPVVSSSSPAGNLEEYSRIFFNRATTSLAGISSTTLAKYRAIEKIDFSDFFAQKYETSTTIATDSLWAESPCPSDSVHVDTVDYGDLTGDAIEEAVVRFETCFTGNGGNDSGVYALDANGNIVDLTPYSVLVKVPIFDKYYGEHGYYNNDKGRLTFAFPAYDKDDLLTGDGITIYFKWQKNKFVYDKAVTEPNAYINEEADNPTLNSENNVSAGEADFSTSTSIISPSTPDAQWLTFSDKKLGFSVDYPRGVDVMSGDGGVDFGDATGQYPWFSGVRVHQENESIDQFFQSASKQVSLPDKLAVDSLLMIDNEPAMVFHESGSEADINRTAIVSHDNKLFEIDVNSYYDTTTKTILNSFRFLK